MFSYISQGIDIYPFLSFFFFEIIEFYGNRVMECEIMESALKILANKFKKMKFVKILSTTCIPNYPVKKFFYLKSKTTIIFTIF